MYTIQYDADKENFGILVKATGEEFGPFEVPDTGFAMVTLGSPCAVALEGIDEDAGLRPNTVYELLPKVTSIQENVEFEEEEEEEEGDDEEGEEEEEEEE